MICRYSVYLIQIQKSNNHYLLLTTGIQKMLLLPSFKIQGAQFISKVFFQKIFVPAELVFFHSLYGQSSVFKQSPCRASCHCSKLIVTVIEC